MSCSPYPCDDVLRQIALRHGATRVGVAEAAEIDAEAAELWRRWLAEGRHASMAYLEKYDAERRDPRLLLEGARSVIVCAFNYLNSAPSESPIAMYARGDDYHEVIRGRLSDMAAEIREVYGGSTRVCVDTAPLRERYWAAKAGVGVIGLNNQLIIPGEGSFFFIGVILSTVRFAPDAPIESDCGRCGRCVAACPGGAIGADGSFDARRCLSYLTIEHRGELPPGTDLKGHLYGCDDCQLACPHNAAARLTEIAELGLRPALRGLTPADVAAMTPDRFSAIFSHSAVKRAKLAGLRRNAAQISTPGSPSPAAATALPPQPAESSKSSETSKPI